MAFGTWPQSTNRYRSIARSRDALLGRHLRPGLPMSHGAAGIDGPRHADRILCVHLIHIQPGNEPIETDFG